jgi:hypothetical protein
MRTICYWCALESNCDPAIFRSEHRLENCDRHNTPKGMFEVFADVRECREKASANFASIFVAAVIGGALIIGSILLAVL